MLSTFIILYLPLVIFVLLSFSALSRNKLSSFPFYLSLVLCIIMIAAYALSPDDFSIDKPRYTSMFQSMYLWGITDVFKDSGWIIYMWVCTKIFNNNVVLFYLLTASVYVISYLLFSRKYFDEKSFYFIVMSMGCLGFSSYATNTLRAGFAIAFIMFGLVSEKKFWKLLFMLSAVMLHRSMIIPILGYFFAVFVKKDRVFYLIWIVCLILSLANFNLNPLIENLGFLDERVESYGETLNSSMLSSYKMGFRWDFLIYSIIPMLISVYNIKKHSIEDTVLSRLLNMYIFVNAIWLLVIRISYSDRLAYLSWFLIPFITLYPVVKYSEKYSNPNGLTIGIMGIFMGLDIVLLLL